MSRQVEKVTCALCKEREATKRLTITTEGGMSFGMVLCDVCTDQVGPKEVLSDEKSATNSSP